MLAELLTTPDLPVPIALASYERLRSPGPSRIQRAAYEVTRGIGNRSAPTDLFPDFITQDAPV